MRHESQIGFSDTVLSKLRGIADTIKDFASSFKVYTSEGNFDFIKENLLFYDLGIDSMDDHSEMVNRIHAEFSDLYKNRQSQISGIVRSFKTIEDYDTT